MSPILVFEVLRGTPFWVFILLAYLLRTGLSQLKPSVRTLRRAWLTPLLFIAWGLMGLIERRASTSQIAVCWLAGAGIGAFISAQINLPMKIDRLRGLVWQQGSVVPLIRNLALFFAHYLLRVAAAMHPQTRGTLVAWDIVISGLSAGYFIAWAIRFARVYARAPEADLGVQAVGATVTAR